MKLQRYLFTTLGCILLITLSACIWEAYNKQHITGSRGKLVIDNIKLQKFSEVGESKGEVVNSHNASKLVLFYTTVYGKRLNIQKYLRNDCEYKCHWSTKSSDYKRSDAVVFHLYNNLDMKDFVLSHLPIRRSQQQKWVLMAKEPQAFFYPQQLKLLNDLFNLTMTFQSDSDVPIPQGRTVPKPPADANKVDYFTKRDKMVAWMASNCITSSRREMFVEELQKFIHVDVYGGCGDLKGGKDNWSRDKYRQTLATQYKFYLALENSDCDDYITEKFWRNLDLGMIPIVRGQRAPYKKYAPPNSYIHADSFISVKTLADYLKEVASNSTLFHQYHQWRSSYRVKFKPFSCNERWVCDLCERVHNSQQQTVDVYKHYSEDTRCFTYMDTNGRNRSSEHVEDITRV